ncbi:MAG: hypothetical protein BGO78_05550 [Chloroflexi bacterium 44-23]|mgnify:CR=1 FL=1|nr:MAG: hypothetical protein BGO78_05550 [Chloroflexi bacterium 44-23]
MKKQIISRIIIGFPVGVLIAYVISIIISLLIGKGQYYATEPSLIVTAGNEINAVLLQFVLAGIYGAIWAGSSAIWENEDWSLLKMTVVHFLITSISTYPIAYFTHWMAHDLAGMAIYFAVFIGIYASVWAGLYGVWRNRIKLLNAKIQEGSK